MATRFKTDIVPLAPAPDEKHEGRVVVGALLPSRERESPDHWAMAAGTNRLEPPHVAQELFLGEHSRGLGRKHAQERERLRRQIDLSLAHSHIATCGIDPQLADLKRSVSSALLQAPRESVDPRRLLRVVERLAYLVV
jgi:hypothetical protein